MQTPTPTPQAPAAPAAPVAPAPPPGLITMPGTTPIPLTSQDVASIRFRREELSNQLISAADRRSELAKELLTMPPGPARTGLEERIAVLDGRIVQLESDIAATGRQLTSEGAGSVSGSGVPGLLGLPPRSVTTISSLFILFVLAPIALSFARSLWRRGTRMSIPPVIGDQTRKLEDLQQAVDAIAIEVERVSEGQRFVTKLLSDATRPSLAARREEEAEQVPRL